MKHVTPSRFESAEAFHRHLVQLDREAGCDAKLETEGALTLPLVRAGFSLPNRLALHPMEGWDGTPDGAPTDATLRRWGNFGRSGAGLVWGGEAFAVDRAGRANPNQLFLNDTGDVQASLAALRSALARGARGTGVEQVVGLQLTHSGRWARPEGAPAPKIAAHHPAWDRRAGIPADLPLLTDGELEQIGARFVLAARAAQEAGFAFVDIKCCHGYLLHEVLSARSRPGPYGGSFENRTRLFRRIVSGVRAEAPGLIIGVRLSASEVLPHEAEEGSGIGVAITDGFSSPLDHGFGIDVHDPTRFDLDQPLAFLDLCAELDIAAINVSLGSPYTCPHLQRPAAYPPSDGYLPPRDPLLDVLEHLRVTRELKRARPELLIVGSGYSYLQEYLAHVAQREVRVGNVDVVGIGRMLLSYPELPLAALRGEALDRKRLCRTFSDCTTGPRNGMISGCYPLDPWYKSRPEAAQLRELKASARRVHTPGELKEAP